MKMAADKARAKLLKYYNKVTPLYCIASALDPRINLEYFQNEDWDDQYIKEWTTKMEEIWELYKPSKVQKIAMKEKITDEDAFVSSIYKKRQRIAPNDELEQ